MALSNTSLILVTVMNNLRDMEIARLLGWYRIPLRSAPKVVSVDYLAFYQTGAFGDERWRIQYTAEVRGHELATRAELLKDEAEHPHSQHEYYKIQLGPLERLEKPIPAGKWRRITFFYTTGEYLLQARSVDDLIIQSEDRRMLWQALRDRAQQLRPYEATALPDLDVDAAVISALLGLSDAD